MPDIKEYVHQYLQKLTMMQLATLGEDGPWACTVWFAFDDELNLYFISGATREHAKHIERDNRVAGAMAVPQTANEPQNGLQFKGAATKLTDPADVARVRSFYDNRVLTTEMVDKLLAKPDNPHAFYCIKPSLYKLFDIAQFPDSPLQEWRPEDDK